MNFYMIDLEGELIKGCLLSIDANLLGKRDEALREKIKMDISIVIHGMFNGFEAMNKVDKQYGR